jgi:hypothetical protein
MENLKFLYIYFLIAHLFYSASSADIKIKLWKILNYITFFLMLTFSTRLVPPTSNICRSTVDLCSRKILPRKYLKQRRQKFVAQAVLQLTEASASKSGGL